MSNNTITDIKVFFKQIDTLEPYSKCNYNKYILQKIEIENAKRNVSQNHTQIHIIDKNTHEIEHRLKLEDFENFEKFKNYLDEHLEFTDSFEEWQN